MDVTDNVRYVNIYKLKCIDLPSFKTKFDKGSILLSFKFDFQSDSTQDFVDHKWNIFLTN